jgi:predicted ester cyclase
LVAIRFAIRDVLPFDYEQGEDVMGDSVTQKIVSDGFAYLNERRLDEFFGLYAPEVRNPSLANMGLPTNLDGFKAFVGTFYSSFSNPQFLSQTVLCDGDTAMFRWVFKGKHTGDFNGVKPTGKDVQVDAFTTFRLGPNGKIIEQHDVANTMTLLRQIGATASVWVPVSSRPKSGSGACTRGSPSRCRASRT